MRWVIVGAGAVGGVVGGLLAHSGQHVTLVARGAHMRAMRSAGLRVRTPDLDVRVTPSIVDSVRTCGLPPLPTFSCVVFCALSATPNVSAVTARARTDRFIEVSIEEL